MEEEYVDSDEVSEDDNKDINIQKEILDNKFAQVLLYSTLAKKIDVGAIRNPAKEEKAYITAIKMVSNQDQEAGPTVNIESLIKVMCEDLLNDGKKDNESRNIDIDKEVENICTEFGRDIIDGKTYDGEAQDGETISEYDESDFDDFDDIES